MDIKALTTAHGPTMNELAAALHELDDGCRWEWEFHAPYSPKNTYIKSCQWRDHMDYAIQIYEEVLKARGAS